MISREGSLYFWRQMETTTHTVLQRVGVAESPQQLALSGACDQDIMEINDGSSLTDEILEQPRYQSLRSLVIRDNPNVTSLKHLPHLEELDISGRCGVGDAGIQGCISLKRLNADDNPRITTANHLVSLETLHAAGVCGIGDAGIQGCLDLRVLIIDDNSKITSANHLSKLEVLHAGGGCGLDDAGIRDCVRLRVIWVPRNHKITDLDLLRQEKELRAQGVAMGLPPAEVDAYVRKNILVPLLALRSTDPQCY